MKIKYIDEKGELLSSTEDYIPNIGELIKIYDFLYEVRDRKISIVALHTEIEIYLTEIYDNG
jgi:hypothetical protein